MPFQILRNDIVNMQVDAIVNTANPKPLVGAGTDAAIHAKAGPRLLEARKAIGSIPVGKAAVTPGFELSAKFVIHTVGPVWRGGLLGEGKLLRSCYDTALALALQNGCRSIAFPLISSGSYGYPKDKALQIAIAAFSEFLTEHQMQIYLVVFDQEAYHLSEKLFSSVASYIDAHYVAEKEYIEYCGLSEEKQTAFRRQEERCAMPAPAMAPRPMAASSLEALLAKTDAGFSETLMKLIDKTGKKDADIYNKAYVSRQHFSKIRNNPHYKPTKATAIAFALALELDLAQTKDLIGRAGFALTNSSKFDVIIMYFIQQKNYNIADINMVLYEFDQPCLGS